MPNNAVTRVDSVPPITARLIKEAVNTGTEIALDAALRFETRAHRLAFATEDVQEGITAFIEKTARQLCRPLSVGRPPGIARPIRQAMRPAQSTRRPSF